MVQMVALAAKIMTPISETRNPLTRAAGFTLLELTLVLLILGLASVLVVPNLGGLESRNFNAQVREATSLLNYARRIAVVKGVPGKAIFHIAEDDSELDQVASRSASSGSWVSQGIAVEYRDSTEQLVEVEDQRIAIGQQPPHQGPADEAGTAGYQNSVDPLGQQGDHGLNQAFRRLPGNAVHQTFPTRRWHYYGQNPL